jgi:hypothetical protein
MEDPPAHTVVRSENMSISLHELDDHALEVLASMSPHSRYRHPWLWTHHTCWKYPGAASTLPYMAGIAASAHPQYAAASTHSPYGTVWQIHCPIMLKAAGQPHSDCSIGAATTTLQVQCAVCCCLAEMLCAAAMPTARTVAPDQSQISPPSVPALPPSLSRRYLGGGHPAGTQL